MSDFLLGFDILFCSCINHKCITFHAYDIYSQNDQDNRYSLTVHWKEKIQYFRKFLAVDLSYIIKHHTFGIFNQYLSI